VPLTATSANLSGQDESSSALAIADRFKEKVHLYIDAGPLVSKVSTVVDCTGSEPVVIREGAISGIDIHAVWQEK
jgi:tRNA A37 threonylcarbamoyladenosine synthetase subunit TsaC/SUA5/YrdC